MKKNVVLFGASGNIGQQSIEILKGLKEKFNLIAISVGNNTNFVENIINEFKTIKLVYSINKIDELENKYKDIKFINKDINSLINDNVDIVINGLSGFFGLQVTLESIVKEKILLNANKESFVTAGNLINNLLEKHKNAKVYPLDSEHCAIFQCLEKDNKINRIYLTASGGSFKNLSLEETKKVTLEQALKHPNWTMGNKITIDSSTMFNKAFEILEAYFLFNSKNIVTLIHEQSIIHSMVEFEDGSIKAQLSIPDMKQVINYFLNYPNRINYEKQKNMDFKNLITLNLKEIDQTRFKPIKFALECLKLKNSKSIALNASNEICVEQFLQKKIEFYQITEIVEKIFYLTKEVDYNNYEDIKKFDKFIRNQTLEVIEEIKCQ